MTVSARLEPASIPVEPGQTGQVTLHLRNGGEIVEAYRVEVVGDPAGWCVVEPVELSLYPGTAGTVTLTLAPPRGPVPAAGEYPFAVRVLPTERPLDVQVPEGSVDVLPFQELEIELSPRSSHARIGARYQVAVRNAGNAPAPVEITAQQADGKLKLRVRPATEELGSGEQGHFRIRARAKRIAVKGRPQNIAFQVMVAHQDSAAETAETANGSFEQRPLLSRGAFKALAAMAVVVAALVAAWFALVKPAITSAANTAAGAQASQAASAAAVAQHQAAVASASASAAAASASASATPSTQASPTPPPPAPDPATTANYYKSLSLQTGTGRTDTATFTVPAHSTFMLTDFVLENPQGDDGTISLSIGGSQVSLLALEDFRDTDYPWVTPLEVASGETVAITVDCRQPGSPPKAAQPTTCAESALLNGSMVTAGAA